MVAVGDRVVVTSGKWDGHEGTVTACTEKTCRIELDDGTVTGNLKLSSIQALLSKDSQGADEDQSGYNTPDDDSPEPLTSTPLSTLLGASC